MLRKRRVRAEFAYNLRFSGQVFDGQAGLHYNGLRDYDPAIGRFVESDPVGIVSGINTFSYASSNSLSVFDPSGLSSVIYNPSAGVVTVVKDKAGRQGYRHATDGCIRTTDDTTRLLDQLMHSGDPLTSLIVTDSPVATNIPSVDPSLNGGPALYPPDPRL
jgi:RHS repeat-associated protein